MSSQTRVRSLARHMSASAGSAAAAEAAGGAGTRDFEFSLATGELTSEEREFYEEHGFIVKRRLLDEEDLDRWRSRFVDLCTRRADRPPTMLVMRDISLAREDVTDDERFVYKIQDFQDDDVMMSYCTHPAIIPIVRSFTGPDIKAMHTMLINKAPVADSATSRHPMHQDLWYFPFRPANRVVCSWTAMQHVHRDNGCLSVIPGSHRRPLYRHSYPDWGDGKVNKAFHGIHGALDGDMGERVHLEMRAGDTVFFHPLLIHGSGANRTAGYRKAISCHYASSTCEYIQVRGTMQEEIAVEVEEIAKRKSGLDVDFRDVWRFKSRLVAGQEYEWGL